MEADDPQWRPLKGEDDRRSSSLVLVKQKLAERTWFHGMMMTKG